MPFPRSGLHRSHMARTHDLLLYIVIASLMLTTTSTLATDEENTMAKEQDSTEHIGKTLETLRSAIESHDLDTIVSLYSDDYADAQGNTGASIRGYFERLDAMGILKDAKVDLANLRIEVEGDSASAGPVTYRTAAGTAVYVYDLRAARGDRWLIAGRREYREGARTLRPASAPLAPMDAKLRRLLAGNAGRVVERNAMVWERILSAPIEKVWELVSTLEGMKKWWIVPPSTFELKPGGSFKHHWENRVIGFREQEYIDFGENTGDYAGTGGMRIEVRKIDAKTTYFAFLDTWGPGMRPGGEGVGAEQPGGPGTPWADVAAGWHSMVDKLAQVIDGSEPAYTHAQLTEFYAHYLRDHYKWNAMVQRRP